MASAQDLQPTCEDYHSDDSDGPVSFQGRSSPNAANVSTKRSHPSDLDKEKPPAQERAHPNCDLRSDSGYSSYTAATSSSTNSTQSAPSQQSTQHVAAQPQAVPPPLPDAPPPPQKTRRPTQSDARPNGSSSTSRPRGLSRSASTSTKPAAEKRRPTITQEHRPDRTRRDSRLEESSAPPLRRRPTVTRPELQPSQSAKEVNRLSINTQDTRSMRSDPAYYPSPPSPSQARHQTQYYKQGQVVVQPATARPRRSSTARPMSYSGEGPQYYMGNPYPSPPQEPHGPPLSHSAYQNMGYGMPNMGPHAPYPAANGYPMPPYGYDGQERPVRHANNMARNGPKPVITQAPPRDPYSARRHQAQSASATQTRFPTTLQIESGAYESESASESDYSEDEYYEPEPTDERYGRAIMPPPPAPKAKSKSKKEKPQRPTMRHANTTQVVDVDRSRRQSLVVQDAGRQRSAQVAERRKSVSRPVSLQRQVQSEYPARGGAQVVVNRSEKSERRRSAQVYDTAYNYEAYREERERADRRAAKEAKEAKARQREEKAARKAAEAAFAAQYEAEEQQRKRSNRNSKVMYDAPGAFYSGSDDEEDDEEEYVPEAPAPPARTRRGTDAGKGKGRVGEHKIKRIESAAEEYISAQRGTHNPLNDHIHSAAKKASRVPSMPSHSGSSGSEKHSQSNRTAVANANNEIRLRVDANAPLSLQFNGDMEGRTLRMIPAENGMADLVISGGRGESQYNGSDRGSNSGDKMALVRDPRRQAEEMTETSGRSHRRRESRLVREHERDVAQRPLRRRAHTATTYTS
ncbi:hypothetical protein PtrSN002B_011299 [Pyrenophora tritici-repentis]|uniref:DUF1421 multi-domain protein n=2 Tax=Pyrenophora tritici-repentis TaxID=45151 RepID=A0A2W1DWP2_9PLEO|nr:uncharacterized protein PTRG_11374 [Pyrenophora tritici-repentis Pt-1C-BFP]KAA8624394.1 hypothetical protein PtrV1_00074 [Pyrenophora tritici-repentis]EDU44424.1 hypothetical protein PTRG_11374 [Pyrenophora tritici-repentis Pt-1C-BFP]KAF7452798.1 hypothetical protein A1F99_000560 [Pyrenophora tritici-repentis]KAF7575823.1 DUF1421 multi-domain protein [Pyrenophora tritici-repentis]KAG9377757.1 hypothetical protein A1F94_012160 [Pyrenophora tritici-repentis]